MQFFSYYFTLVLPVISTRKTAYLFNGRNILDHSQIKEIGFDTHAIGMKERGSRQKAEGSKQ